MNKMSRVALFSVLVVSAHMFATDAAPTGTPATENQIATNSTANNTAADDAAAQAAAAQIAADKLAADTAAAAAKAAADKPAAAQELTPGMLAKLATFPVIAQILGTPKFVSSWTFTWALNQIAKIGFLKDGRFARNTDKIGQVMTVAAMAALIYTAYTMYTAEEAVDANEDFFAEDAN
jgi:hypothetical protein